MAKNRREGGRAERALRSALWRRGFRFRLHQRELPGKPDLVFRSSSLCVFCDGDFWHGRDWQKRRLRLESGSNREYWVAKIQGTFSVIAVKPGSYGLRGGSSSGFGSPRSSTTQSVAADLVVRELRVQPHRVPEPRLPKMPARVARTASAQDVREHGRYRVPELPHCWAIVPQRRHPSGNVWRRITSSIRRIRFLQWKGPMLFERTAWIGP